IDRAHLIRWMVGRDLSEEFPSRPSEPAEQGPRGAGPGDRGPLLDVRHLEAPPFFSDVSLTVRRGEIVGLAGLVGAGRTSFALALFGVIPARGAVSFGGAPYKPRRPRDAMAGGLAYVTEDRAGSGLFPLLSACANITITRLGAFVRGGVVSEIR